jgi:hypothetical protein
LARLIFHSIEIEDDRVVAIVPQPDFAPFFIDRHQRENGGDGNTPEGSGGVNREIEEAEATGDRSVGYILPVGALVIAIRPPLRVGGRSKRATYRSPRQRKLSAEQVEAIQADAGNRTLRELAAEFGVSHETVRSIISDRRP